MSFIVLNGIYPYYISSVIEASLNMDSFHSISTTPGHLVAVRSLLLSRADVQMCDEAQETPVARP